MHPETPEEAKVYRGARECAEVEAIEAGTPRDRARKYGEQAGLEALNDYRAAQRDKAPKTLGGPVSAPKGANVAIVPHSTDALSLDGLESTLQSLRHGGHLHRVDGEVYLDSAGIAYACVIEPRFVIFAINRQGYAKKAFPAR